MVDRKMLMFLVPVLVTLVATLDQVAAGQDRIAVPDRIETMGRITLSLTQEGQVYTHQLAFEETYDTVGERARVSIGYIGYETNLYFHVGERATLSQKDNVCAELISNRFKLVPELSWFMERIFDRSDLQNDYLYLIGPTGIRFMLANAMKGTDYELVRSNMDFKNVPTDLYSKTVKLGANKFNVKSDLYLMKPNADQTEPFDASKYLSGTKEKRYVVITVTPGRNNTNQFEKASLTFDMSDTNTIDDDDLANMESKLLLPVGCGHFAETFKPKVEAQSFSLVMKQLTKYTDVLVAYDHKRNYLRREILGKSIDVWDMNEELMYHIDGNISLSNMEIISRLKLSVETCSLLRVKETYCPVFRPFINHTASLDVLEFLGAKEIAYVGQSTIEGKPVYVYESFHSTWMAPALFASKDDDIGVDDGHQMEYVIRYFFAINKRLPDNKPEEINGEKFLPIMIQLYKRNTNTHEILLNDLLEIKDFHWSLNGWNRKPGEMFMVPECFTDDNEQLRVEMVIKFDNTQDQLIREEHRAILNHNKFALEDYLIDSVFTFFDMSRQHLISYELNFKPHHVEFNFVVGDRDRERNLVQLKRNFVDTKKCQLSDGCIELPEKYHDDCVTLGSLISEVDYVVYCDHMVTNLPKCLAYKSPAQPKYWTNYDAPDSSDDLCEVYQFISVADSPKRATVHFDQFRSTLDGFLLVFEASIPGKSNKLELRGQVVSWDVEREIPKFSMPHHRYRLDTKVNSKGLEDGLLSLEGVKLVGDCEQMCNLDVDCGSYSFCPKPDDETDRCIISKLIIENKEIQTQIYESRPTMVDGKAQMTLDQNNQSYTLRYEDECSIYGRDFLSMFSQTDEFVRITNKNSPQLLSSPSAVSCAKAAVRWGMGSPEASSKFAYCAQTSECLIEGDQAMEIMKGSDDELKQSDLDTEKVCSVFRRKYQTYFHMSIPVVVPAVAEEQQQVVSGSTVEECAHTCWNDFGDSCHSFDFCSGQDGCFINKVATSDAKTETKSGCMHYERDLRLDEIRREHAIGRHQLLVRSNGFTFGQFIMFSFLLLPLTVGLFIGTLANNHLDRVKILRESFSGPAGSGIRFSQAFGDSLFRTARQPNNSASINSQRFEDEDIEDTGIQMGEIKPGKNNYKDDMDEPLAGDF